MNVVIYARFSSHAQNEQSIEGQLQECYAYAEKNGYIVINEYIDRAYTGKKADNRPAFMEMITDSKQQRFEGILVYQLDRFSRNRNDSIVYKSLLKKNGVRVISVRENITEDASGILVEGLLESMAEYFSAELAQKTKRGTDISASKCQYTGGTVALGYKVNSEKKLVIDDATAHIVQIIYDMYAAGKTITEIITHLNRKGFRTSKGEEYRYNSLSRILRNKRYIGIYTYNDMEIPGGTPRIISDELFAKVQARLEKNKKAPAHARAKSEYLLTTKLFCGHCREMMTGMSGTSKSGNKHTYYICKGARKKLCRKKTVPKDVIENRVIEECRQLLFTDDKIDQIVKAVIEVSKKDSNSTERKRLQKVLQENLRKQNNLIDAIADCDKSELRKPLYAKVALLEEQRNDLEIALAQEQATAEIPAPEAVRFFLIKLRDGDINDLKYRKALINIFIQAIYLYDDKLTLYLTVGGKPMDIDAKLIETVERSNAKARCSSTLPGGLPVRRHLR